MLVGSTTEWNSDNMDAVTVLHRIESALQQNEIMDVFFDDWAALTLDDGSFGSKADNHLKVTTAFLYLV